MVLISSIAFAITNIKKMKEIYKEKKFHQKITVNLSMQQPHEGAPEGYIAQRRGSIFSIVPLSFPLKFNNLKNNVPIYNGLQLALLVGFILSSMIIFCFLDYAFNDSKHFYSQFVFKEFSLVFVYNIVIPLIYLTQKKKMRKYLWNYVTAVTCN